MIDIIIGLIVVFLFTPKEREYDDSSRDDIIRPILMEEFDDHDTGDFGGE